MPLWRARRLGFALAFERPGTVDVYRLAIMGRKVDLDDLIDVGEVAELLGLAHKNSVTTYMRRYDDFPTPVIEFADGKCRAWVRDDVRDWSIHRARKAKGE